jgi:hypothetical protein
MTDLPAEFRILQFPDWEGELDAAVRENDQDKRPERCVDGAFCVGRPGAGAPLHLIRGKALLEIIKPVLVLVIVFSPTITWSQTQATDQSSPLEYAQQNPTSQSNPAPAPPTDSGTVSLPEQAPAPPKQKRRFPGPADQAYVLARS